MEEEGAVADWAEDTEEGEGYIWDNQGVPEASDGLRLENRTTEDLKERMAEIVSDIEKVQNRISNLLDSKPDFDIFWLSERVLDMEAPSEFVEMSKALRQQEILSEEMRRISNLIEKRMERVGREIPVYHLDDSISTGGGIRTADRLVDKFNHSRREATVNFGRPLGGVINKEMEANKENLQADVDRPTTAEVEQTRDVLNTIDRSGLALTEGRVPASSYVTILNYNDAIEKIQTSKERLTEHFNAIQCKEEVSVIDIINEIDLYYFLRHEVLNILVHQSLGVQYGHEKKIRYTLSDYLIVMGANALYEALYEENNTNYTSSKELEEIAVIKKGMEKTPDFFGPLPDNDRMVLMDVSVGYGSHEQTKSKQEKYGPILDALSYFGISIDYLHYHADLSVGNFVEISELNTDVTVEFPWEMIREVEDVVNGIKNTGPKEILDSLQSRDGSNNTFEPILSEEAMYWAEGLPDKIREVFTEEDAARLLYIVENASIDTTKNLHDMLGKKYVNNVKEFVKNEEISFNKKVLERVDTATFNKSIEEHSRLMGESFEVRVEPKSYTPVLYTIGVRMSHKEQNLYKTIEYKDPKHRDLKFWCKILHSKPTQENYDADAYVWLEMLKNMFKVFDTDPDVFSELKLCKTGLDINKDVVDREPIEAEFNKKVEGMNEDGRVSETFKKVIAYKKAGVFGFNKNECIYFPKPSRYKEVVEELAGIGAKKKKPSTGTERQWTLDYRNKVYTTAFDSEIKGFIHGKTYGELMGFAEGISKGFTNFLMLSNQHKDFKVVHTGDLRNIIIACPCGGSGVKEGDNLYFMLTLIPHEYIKIEKKHVFGLQNVAYKFRLKSDSFGPDELLYISKPFRLSNNRIQNLMESLSAFETALEVINYNIESRDEGEILYQENQPTNLDDLEQAEEAEEEEETFAEKLEENHKEKYQKHMRNLTLDQINSFKRTETEKEQKVMYPRIRRPMFEPPKNCEDSSIQFSKDSMVKKDYELVVGTILCCVLSQNIRISNYLDGGRYMLPNCVGTHSGVHHYLLDSLVTPCQSILDCKLMKNLIEACRFNIEKGPEQKSTALIFSGTEMLENQRTYVHWPSKGLLKIEYNNPNQLTRELNTLFFCVKKGLHPDTLNKIKLNTKILEVQKQQEKDGVNPGGRRLEDYLKGKFARSDYNVEAVMASTYMALRGVHDKQKVRDKFKYVMDGRCISQPTFISSKSQLSNLETRKEEIFKIRTWQAKEVDLVKERLRDLEEMIRPYKELLEKGDLNIAETAEFEALISEVEDLADYGIIKEFDPDFFEEWQRQSRIFLQERKVNVGKSTQDRILKNLEAKLSEVNESEHVFKELQLSHAQLNDLKFDTETGKILTFSEFRMRDERKLKAKTGGQVGEVYVRDKVVNVTARFAELERVCKEQNYDLGHMLVKTVTSGRKAVVTADSKKQRTPEDREIYIGNDVSKYATYMIECLMSGLCKQLPGELISVSGDNKILEIQKQVKLINQYHNSMLKKAKGGKLKSGNNHKFFANLDMTKWSPKDNLYKFIWVIAFLDFLTKKEKFFFMRLILILSEKLLYIDPSLLLKMSEKDQNELYDEVIREMTDNFRVCFIPITFNWFQGFLNYLSSFVHYGATLVLSECLQLLFDHCMYTPLVHSDDHLSMVSVNTSMTYDDSVSRFLRTLTTVFTLNTMEPSVKKSYVAKETAELVSERNVHGVQESDWSKPLMSAESALPCTGLKEDMSAVLSKVQEAAAKGAPSHTLKTVCYRHIVEVRQMYGIETKNPFAEALGIPVGELPLFMGGNYHGTHTSLVLGAARAADGYTFASALPVSADPIGDKIKTEKLKTPDMQWSVHKADGTVDVSNVKLRLLHLSLWQTVDSSDIIRSDIAGGINPFLFTSMRTIPPTDDLAYDYREDYYATQIQRYDKRRLTANILKPTLQHDVIIWLKRMFTKKDFLVGLKSMMSIQRMIQRRMQSKQPMVFIKKLLGDNQDITVNYFMSSNRRYTANPIEGREELNDLERYTQVHKKRPLTVAEVAQLMAEMVKTVQFDEKKLRDLADFLYYPYQILQLDKTLPKNEIVIRRIDNRIVKRPVYSPNISYSSTFKNPITLVLQYTFDKDVFQMEHAEKSYNDKIIESDSRRLTKELGGHVSLIKTAPNMARKLMEQVMRSSVTRTGKIIYMYRSANSGVINQYLSVLGSLAGEPYYAELMLKKPWIMDKGKLQNLMDVDQVLLVDAVKALSNVIAGFLLLDDMRSTDRVPYERLSKMISSLTVGKFDLRAMISDTIDARSIICARILFPIVSYMKEMYEDDKSELYNLATSGRIQMEPGAEEISAEHFAYYEGKDATFRIRMQGRIVISIDIATRESVYSPSVSSEIEQMVDRLEKSIGGDRKRIFQVGKVTKCGVSAPGVFFLTFSNGWCRKAKLQSVVGYDTIIAGIPVTYYKKLYYQKTELITALPAIEDYKGVVYLLSDEADYEIIDGYRIVKPNAEVKETFYLKRSDRTACNYVNLLEDDWRNPKPFLVGPNGMFNFLQMIRAGMIDWIINKSRKIHITMLEPYISWEETSTNAFLEILAKGISCTLESDSHGTISLTEQESYYPGFDWFAEDIEYLLEIPEIEMPSSKEYNYMPPVTASEFFEKTLDEGESLGFSNVLQYSSDYIVKNRNVERETRLLNTDSVWGFLRTATEPYLTNEYHELLSAVLGIRTAKDRNNALFIYQWSPIDTLFSLLAYPGVFSRLFLFTHLDPKSSGPVEPVVLGQLKDNSKNNEFKKLINYLDLKGTDSGRRTAMRMARSGNIPRELVSTIENEMYRNVKRNLSELNNIRKTDSYRYFVNMEIKSSFMYGRNQRNYTPLALAEEDVDAAMADNAQIDDLLQDSQILECVNDVNSYLGI
uniref:RNA-dependent RNA polymerase n=1 Tax=Hubei orthoptera virus 2 TaxID=1923010 RepID=A0A1L3KPP7_9VIRU|nr:RNA-dependent RNA polymerase [Hubei orthoptera virus 2]